jgi:RimJ/RimL family protein N-acetyltransferase
MNVRALRSDEGQLFKDMSIKMCTEVPTAYRLTLAEADARTDEQWQQLAAESASSPTMESFVGEISGEPCGFVMGTVLPQHVLAVIEGRTEEHAGHGLTDTTLLGSMWVAPHMRGQGLAQLLIQAVLTWAKENNQRRVMLAVTQGNERALRCYVRFQFRQTGFALTNPSNHDLVVDFMDYVL